MLKKFVRIVGGDPNQKEIDKYKILVDQINQLESTFERLSDAELSSKTNEFKFRLASGQTLDDLLVDVFAVVREASKRSLGMRHFDVQLIGGIALHQGKIAEMRTGEGKTLVATLPLYLNALTGRGVHLVTVNDYLARRDARWMAPIYNMLGLSVGVLQMAARTENGKKAFIVDLERQSPHEDQNQLQMVVRQQAYLADITYGTNSEFGFDYLRDNMTMRLEERVQRGFNFAIVDEVDNVLIDEARTPLIISGPAQDEAEWYIRTSQVVKRLQPEDYEINEKDRTVYLTEIGEIHVEELLGVSLRDPDRPEDITPEQARLLGYLEQSLRAQFLYSRNKEYLVQAGKVVIVDEFTGRLMPGRRWSDGLHQAVEAKEGVKVQSESVTYASITIQNYFRMYEKLAGMTGTAVTESEEFNEIYSLNVLAIPTNLEYIAAHPDTDLVELEDRDEQGYRYYYYAKNNDPENQPVFWKRKDYPDVVYRTEETKLRAITQEILRYHVLGRPLLVGTTSVELSDRVSNRLRSEPLRRLTQILLIRDVWMKKHDQEPDGRQIPELLYLNQPLNHLDTNQMRRSAQELGISFNPEDSDNIDRLLEILNLSSTEKNRLINDLKGGIPHQVLNARKHTEESQIIASAGSFGAVTIATNMAGRGVDIRLGGEVAEEILTSVYRVLSRAGYEKPYELTLEERRQALEQMDQADYGIYGTEINYFLRYLDEMNQVRKLGGLHVIGSERHEARRIDNQLRGRSARQGDPGSSRFYLSMEDELMRLFGGQQADGLMQRLKIDDALPLEVGLVSRLVEQSQGRVEGANFDVRKHLLEYDDVLNTQRARIYDQRNRIFKKDDLKEDVTEMLRVEVKRRIPETMNDEAGPWRLLSWLDQIQPPISVNGIVFPPFSIQQLADEFLSLIPANPNQDLIRESLITIVRQSVDSERLHVLQTIRELLEQTQNRLEIQIAERLETLETFIEGLSLEEDNDHRPLSDILADLSEAIHYPIKLSNSEQKLLFENPQKLEGIIREQIETTSRGIALTRLSGAIERRLEEPLDLKVDIVEDDWFLIEEKILSRVDELYENRINRYVNGDAQISREIDYALDKLSGQFDRQSILQILLGLPQGARASFDKKTHKRVWQKTTRFTYFYYVADLLHSKELETINDQVLKHLENAQEFISRIWGQAEIKRLARYSIQDLNEQARRGFLNALGEADFSIIENQPFEEINHTHRERVIQELGRQTLTEIYRQLLLSVTTELWVEYLTQMEALRVSIGLEAYARQDPLVQYKNKAYGLFQELLDNMRLSVVSRMFTFRPREVSKLQTDSESETQFIEAISPSESISDNDQPTADSEEVILVEEAESGTDDKSPQKAVGNLTSTSKKRRHRYRRK